MFKRQRVGSVVCPGCGSLVGVQDERCYNCGRRNPGMWGFAPMLRRLGNDLGFVSVIIGACAVLYVASLLVTVLLFGPAALGVGGPFSILPPSQAALVLFGESGAVPVFYDGRWWTLLSAGWLHGNLLHIVFNMMWVRQLGPVVSDMYGAGRMMLIYIISGVAGFLLSSFAGAYLPALPFLHGAGYTVGASASIMGLLGALVHYGRRSVSSAVTSQALMYAIVLFFFGITMPGVDNFAHAGGFAGGYVASAWLNPLRPERADHLFAALGCLVLVALSILVSVWLTLPVLRAYLAGA